jgi:hypothetical protein
MCLLHTFYFVLSIDPVSEILYSFSIQISGVSRNFVQGGVQQIQLRTEGRENGDLGAVAP